MIVCSLNEIEIYGRRAARGAGMAWGLAEEAGRAARWIAARGLPGAELLARLITVNDGRPYETMAPVIVNGQWRATAGALCPICTGAAMSDRIDDLVPGENLFLRRMDCPLLLAPFLDYPLPSRDACFQICWTGVRILVYANGAAISCEKASAYTTERAEEIGLSVVTRETLTPTHLARNAGVKVPLSVWRVLDGFARRTYVAASEASRARGAGAGRSDND